MVEQGVLAARGQRVGKPGPGVALRPAALPPGHQGQRLLRAVPPKAHVVAEDMVRARPRICIRSHRSSGRSGWASPSRAGRAERGRELEHEGRAGCWACAPPVARSVDRATRPVCLVQDDDAVGASPGRAAFEERPRLVPPGVPIVWPSDEAGGNDRDPEGAPHDVGGAIGADDVAEMVDPDLTRGPPARGRHAEPVPSSTCHCCVRVDGTRISAGPSPIRAVSNAPVAKEKVFPTPTSSARRSRAFP